MKRSAAVLSVFFASGISALLYQIVWLKYLGLIFGNTVYAAATLIAVFLAGLGIGAFVFSRAFRARPSLLVYAATEALIGLAGAFSPNAFELLNRAYVAAYPSVHQSALSMTLVRGALAAAFLLPPTILMGGTLPLLVRWFTGDEEGSGTAVSALYAVNTLGATAGVALAGFVLIPRVGLLATIFVAVVLNFVLALVAALLLRGRTPSAPTSRGAQRAPSNINPRLVLLITLLLGLAAIADEVFWSRILVLHFGSSVYAYSLMLFSFLIGIGIGSAAIERVVARIDVARTLGTIELALAAVLALQVHVFAHFADLLGAIARIGFTSPFPIFLCASLVVLLVPTALLGAAFPLTVRLYEVSAREGETRSVGKVYLVNTIGSVTGSLLAGFFLIRAVGSQNGLFLTALIALVVGAWLAGKRAVIAAAIFVIAFITAKPNEVILSAGLFADAHAPILLFREDVTATVTLRELGPGYLSLELNGVNVAGTSAELMGTQKLQGHIPLLVHPHPRRVLHIGFGSGGTAWAVSRHPVENITIAEISPEVLEVSGSRLGAVNHGVLHDPRVHVEINDGRNFVLAAPEKFDVILSDSIHPRYAGNGSLYTREYFELCRRRLNDDGVISMWLPMYSLTTRNYLQIVRAFRDVFPNTTIWYVPNTPNAFTIVVGRLENGPLPLARMAAQWTSPVAQDLGEIGMRRPEDLLSALMLGPSEVERITRGVPPHVDDLPSVEYESGRVVDRNLTWLQTFSLLANAMPQQTPVVRAHLRALAAHVLVPAQKKP
ncbi:MAG TPA: fused MFS/spermidine synthase [Thermoanaerobaculia bacterium]|nr:fused MFS/spermidine synthase [Thermoanaerobaculia bacterium]